VGSAATTRATTAERMTRGIRNSPPKSPADQLRCLSAVERFERRHSCASLEGAGVPPLTVASPDLRDGADDQLREHQPIEVGEPLEV